MKRLVTCGSVLVIGALGLVPLSAIAQGGPDVEAYSISGRIAEVEDDEIKLERQGLPNAQLDLKNQTRITVDGRDAKWKDLQRGMQVNARFQIEKDDVVATEIEAKTAAQ